MTSVDSIDIRELQTLYINLDSHPDRNEYMQKMLTDNGFKRFTRQPGILAMPNMVEGWQGTAFSHCCAAKRLYRTCRDKWCLVLEDDIRFTNIDTINRAINDIINKYPNIECITVTNPPEGANVGEIYCPVLPNTYGAHFMLYRRESLLKLARGLFEKWLIGMACDYWRLDELIGIKSAAFYSDACEQLKQSFISQNEHHDYMNIYISNEPLRGRNFNSIVFKNNEHDRFLDTSMYRVYHIDDTEITELFGDNTIKRISLPEQLANRFRTNNMFDKYKALVAYNHSLYPQFKMFRIWNHEQQKWNVLKIR